MKIDRRELEHLCDLARIDITGVDADTFVSDFNQLVEYVDTVMKFDTKDVAPLTSTWQLQNVTRQDEVQSSFEKEEMLEMSSCREDDMIAVPSAVEQVKL